MCVVSKCKYPNINILRCILKSSEIICNIFCFEFDIVYLNNELLDVCILKFEYFICFSFMIDVM